jgi:hypothetical protein
VKLRVKPGLKETPPEKMGPPGKPVRSQQRSLMALGMVPGRMSYSLPP